MPVFLEQLDRHVADCLKRIVNGGAIFHEEMKESGIQVDMSPNGMDVAFSVVAIVPGGLNAIERNQIAGPQSRTSTTEDEATLETTVRGAETQSVDAADSAVVSDESSTESQTGTDNQQQAFGRTTETQIEHET